MENNENIKDKKTQISFQSKASTLKLLNELVWVKQYVIDKKSVSQHDIVSEALQLLSDKMDFKKIRQEHSEILDNYKPAAGRKRKI